MIEQELLNKYRETVSLLEFRKPGYLFTGNFVQDDNNKVAFQLNMFKSFDSEGEWRSSSNSKKTFKYFDTESDALRYFIKVSQNRVY